MQTTKKKLIIIGGGAMGVSLLYHLAKLGWQDLLLLEKNELTAGSTWHAAGLCTHFAHSPTIMQMRAHSVRLYSNELEKDTGMPVSFHQCGALRVTRSEDRMDEFHQVQGLGEFMGYPFHIITPDDLKTLHPLTERGDGLIGGIHEPWDGYVDPSQATHAMAAGARQRGAEILRQTEVTATEQTESGHWRLETSKGLFECELLVNAAGTWCYEVGKMMGVELPVVPMLHQYLVTDTVEAVAALDNELPMIRDPEESWYLRQEGNGLIFGPYEQAAKPWSIDGVPGHFGMELLEPDYEAMMPIMELAMRRVPALETAAIKTVVNGPITFTPDASPLIGPAFGLENAWLLTGSSMGVMEGGGAGYFLAQWLHNGAPPWDALGVDPRRYGDYVDRDFRVAKASECFGRQFAIHFPHEHLPAARNLRLSPLHDTWLEQGAVMGAAYGWERPEFFSTAEENREHELSFGHTNALPEIARECRIASESVAFCDLTLFSKFEIEGEGSTAFLGQLGANTLPAVGRIGLLHVLTAQGGVEMEFTVTRLAEEHYYLTGAAAAERIGWDVLQGGQGVKVTNQTDSLTILAIFGPKAIQLLQSVTETDLCQSAFPWLSTQTINIAGHEIRALRLSYIGEAGMELHMPPSAMSAVYQQLIQAAESQNIEHAPIGMLAVNAMRLEKGYPAWGMDLTTERTPLESVLQAFVKTEGREFTGKAAVLKRQQQQPWQLVLLEIDNPGGPAFGGQPVYLNDQVVGIVTSGAYGHRVEKNLALAYLMNTKLPLALRERGPGGEGDLVVKILGQNHPAIILNHPPFDPQNQRLKA